MEKNISKSIQGINVLLKECVPNTNPTIDEKLEFIDYFIHLKAAFLISDDDFFEELYDTFVQAEEQLQTIKLLFGVDVLAEILEDRKRFTRLLVKNEDEK